MKKRLLSILASVAALAVMLPASASAATAAATGVTIVSGKILFNNVHVGKGIPVKVVCKGNTLNTTTDKTGTYIVQFTKQQCPKNSNVTVTATDNGVSGSVTKKADKETNELNVAIIRVNLPEFGTMTGIGTVFLGGGAFLVTRRRQLGKVSITA